MTTPERLKRRQMIEGTVLVVMGIFMTVQSIYFSFEDKQQRQCFEEKINSLSSTSRTRGDLAERETAATKSVLDIYAKAAVIVQDDPTKPLPKKAQDRLNTELVEALLNYQDEIEKVQAERKENPVPPYPVGACDQ